jgi:hypothetical protein
MNKFSAYLTLIISISIQSITGLIEFLTLLMKIPVEFILIRQLMILELFVQIIEGYFYLWLFLNYDNITNITPKRYFDWAITTPTMLVQLILYLLFLYYRENNINERLEFFNLFNKNFNIIISVLLLNWLMLLFGYLSEIKVLPVAIGVILGFIPFLIYYYLIYTNFVLTETGNKMFFYFLFFWSLYGIVALLPYHTKNMLYNILDLFSKNFVGLFLAYIIFTGKY